MAEETTTTEVQELESLEKQNQENLAEVDSADQQSAEESKIVEKNGELYLQTEEGTEEPETDSSEDGQTGKDNQSVSSESEKTEVEEPEAYQAKSRQDIIDMHLNATKKIGEQGDELGKLRKSEDVENMSTEELKSRFSADDLRQGYEAEKAVLAGLDPVMDEDKYIEQTALVDQIQTDWLEKNQQEIIERKFNTSDNEEFIKTQREKYEKGGIEISGDDFDAVTEMAQNYVENGKLTDRGYTKAMLDKFGTEQVLKFYSMSGEKKARSDISSAASKDQTKVEIKGSGKNAKMVRLGDLSKNEMNEALENLSLEELQELSNKYNR
tara:strand:- start:152 stop:1126 length:975 start_codon:yes stop_codon:yes gene_type:complete